jgi:hypothetical protein
MSAYDKAFVGISKLEEDDIYSNLQRLDNKIDARRAVKS